MKTENAILISVLDNGTGIDPSELPKLFNLTQVVTTKGTAGEDGAGLGLLICKNFVEKHGGKIWVESQQGIGSNFKFTLPLPD
jgi:signal transduction histidine kinase